MSLHSTVYKLNNDLISMFAVLDSWCDKDHEFLHGKNKTLLNPYQALHHVIRLNQFVISSINKQGTETALNLLSVKLSSDDLFNTDLDQFVSLHSSAEETNEFTNQPVTVLRDTLREHLFQFLCFLDEVHNSRLDLLCPDVHPGTIRGIEIVQLLTKNVASFIGQCEQTFEYSSGR